MAQNCSQNCQLEIHGFTKKELEIRNAVNSLKSFSKSRNELSEFVIGVRIKLRDLRHALQTLKEYQDVAVLQKEKDFLKEIIESFEEGIVQIVGSLRREHVAAEKRIETLEAEELLQRNDDSKEAQRVRLRNKTRAELAENSGNVTEQLTRIARMMNSQVDQSSESNQVLENSSNIVNETQQEYKGLNGLIQSSRNLLNKYDRRSLTDSLLIIIGVIFFMMTVLYIVSKRL